MTISNIMPPNEEITNTAINQGEMGLRVISLFHVASYLLVIAGLIIGIIYMIKSKRKTVYKVIIGTTIIIIPIIINVVLLLIKTNMYMR